MDTAEIYFLIMSYISTYIKNKVQISDALDHVVAGA